MAGTGAGSRVTAVVCLATLFMFIAMASVVTIGYPSRNRWLRLGMVTQDSNRCQQDAGQSKY